MALSLGTIEFMSGHVAGRWSADRVTAPSRGGQVWIGVREALVRRMRAPSVERARHGRIADAQKKGRLAASGRMRNLTGGAISGPPVIPPAPGHAVWSAICAAWAGV